MASSHDTVSMALFCDFENVALGVRDAKYEKFDIKRVLERLLLKGSIVVKKAYCDWERYKGFKATMHEASFELIEIPHVRQSGKNSADIRLVVDALDLCYTKSHVNTFVIISGDSDFSPLVSKLRENAKQVIGVGVKQSTSDLLIANCDEFIFYDDLVRESERAAAKQGAREAQPAAKRSPDEEKHRREEQEKRKTQAVELAVETFDALVAERGDSGKIWASLLKEAIKRRKPGFNESYYGFRAFGNLLEEAQARGLLDLGRDEKSGAYVFRHNGGAGAAETSSRPEASAAMTDNVSAEGAARPGSRRRRGAPVPAEKPAASELPPTPGAEPSLQREPLPELQRPAAEPLAAEPPGAAPAERAHRAGRRGHGRKPAKQSPGEAETPATTPAPEAHGPASTAPERATAAPDTAATSPAPVATAAAPAAAASPVPTPVEPRARTTVEQQLPGDHGSAPPLGEAHSAEQPVTRGRQRRGRKPDASKAEQGAASDAVAERAAASSGDAGPAATAQAEATEAPAPQRKPTRARRPRKAETTPDEG